MLLLLLLLLSLWQLLLLPLLVLLIQRWLHLEDLLLPFYLLCTKSWERKVEGRSHFILLEILQVGQCFWVDAIVIVNGEAWCVALLKLLPSTLIELDLQALPVYLPIWKLHECMELMEE